MALKGTDEDTYQSSDHYFQSDASQDGVLPTSLHAAAVNGNKTLLQRSLQEGGRSLLNRGDQFGRTPLVYSVLGDRLDCAGALLKAGANVGACDMDGRTPLHWAAYQGNLKCVKLLLSKDANWKVKDYKGRTPLHFATSHQSSKCLSLILKRVPKGEADEPDNDLMTALHWSALYGNANHVKLLLKAGAAVTLTDLEKRTPLHWAALNPDPAVVKLILDANSDIINHQDIEGITALHLAVAKQNEPAVKALLLLDKCEVSIQDNMKRSPLHWAAVLDNPNPGLVKLLLDNGADLTTADNNGATALHYVAQSNCSETVKVLLSQKNIGDITDNEGRTALMWAAGKGSVDALQTMLEHNLDVHAKDKTGSTALHSAAYSGHVSCVELLIEFGACVDALDQLQHTPLYRACEMGHTEVVNNLILNGAAVNLEDQDGRSLLHWAALGGHAPICLALVEQGLAPDTKDHLGRTPLQCAAHGGFVKFMTVLLEHGANVDHQDNEGITALHRSCASGHLEAVKLLLRHKAFPNFTEADTEKLTPLDYAIIGDYQDVAQYMIEQGGFTINGIQDIAATTIQKCWRGYALRKGFEDRKDLVIRHEQMKVKKRESAAEHERCVDLPGNQSPRSSSPSRERAKSVLDSSICHEVILEHEQQRKTSLSSIVEQRQPRHESTTEADVDDSKNTTQDSFMEELLTDPSPGRGSDHISDSDRLKIVCALLLNEDGDLHASDSFLDVVKSRQPNQLRCEANANSMPGGISKAERARRERQRIQLIRTKVNAAIAIQRWFRKWTPIKRESDERNMMLCEAKNEKEELREEIAALTIQLAWRKHARVEFEKNSTENQKPKKTVQNSALHRSERNDIHIYGRSMEEGARINNVNSRKSNKRRSPYTKSQPTASAMSYNMAMDLYHPMASRQGNTRAAMVTASTRVRPGSMRRTVNGWRHDLRFVSKMHGHRVGGNESKS